MSIPSRFLEEVPTQLIENLGGRAPAWSTPAYGNGRGGAYGSGRRPAHSSEFESQHYNYEDESQEAPRISGHSSQPRSKSPKGPEGEHSIDNIARFFGGKPGAIKPNAFARPSMDIPEPTGASGLKKGQRVRHSKYGEGMIVMREGDGEDAKLTVLFPQHGMKKLMEKFANLQKV
jgi:DNA helicase-2/ATP-dependent DNA helicase PcrA